MNINLFKNFFAAVALCVLSCGISHAQSKPAEMIINTPKDLDAGRLKIDSLDKQLMKILGDRERIAKAIGVYKAKNHIPPLQEARFKQVLEKGIAAGNAEGLSTEFVTELLNAIHKESLRIEEK